MVDELTIKATSTSGPLLICKPFLPCLFIKDVAKIAPGNGKWPYTLGARAIQSGTHEPKHRSFDCGSMKMHLEIVFKNNVLPFVLAIQSWSKVVTCSGSFGYEALGMHSMDPCYANVILCSFFLNQHFFPLKATVFPALMLNTLNPNKGNFPIWGDFSTSLNAHENMKVWWKIFEEFHNHTRYKSEI